MARKVCYTLTLKISINESELRLLRLIASRCTVPGKPVELTARSFSDELNLSMATVRRSSKTLQDNLLILVYDTRRDDGGRAANSYVLTSLGRELLSHKGSMRPRRAAPAHEPAVEG